MRQIILTAVLAFSVGAFAITLYPARTMPTGMCDALHKNLDATERTNASVTSLLPQLDPLSSSTTTITAQNQMAVKAHADAVSAVGRVCG